MKKENKNLEAFNWKSLLSDRTFRARLTELDLVDGVFIMGDAIKLVLVTGKVAFLSLAAVMTAIKPMENAGDTTFLDIIIDDGGKLEADIKRIISDGIAYGWAVFAPEEVADKKIVIMNHRNNLKDEIERLNFEIEAKALADKDGISVDEARYIIASK